MNLPIATPVYMILGGALCLLSMAAPLPAQADAPVAAASRTVSSEQEKRNFVSHMAQDAISILYDARQPFASRRRALEHAFNRVVDVPWIARFVLGRSWQAATETQRDRYMALYRRYLSKSYISHFSEDPDKKIRDIKIRAIGRTEHEKFPVQTDMLLANGQTLRVDYVVRDRNNRYKIIDIIIEGVSLLASHRAALDRIASAEGVEGVIRELEHMTRQKSYAMAKTMSWRR